MLQTQEIQKYHKYLHSKIEADCFFPEVTKVEYLENFILKLNFKNGLSKIVDFYPILKDKKGLFEALKNQDYFKNVFIDNELGTIVWNNGLDFSPEFLYNL
ncbi:MAG: DUF2442 domain-containing protein [Rickettsiales bacterium]|nr:DUF2442 domain-containing protein [Rickettsiales bacterium]